LIHGPNGRAAGNCLEEAVVHATNEVFERRVHATILRNRMIMPTIIPETIPSPLIRGQLEFMRAQDIEVTIKDLSFGEVMPCVGAYFKDRAIPSEYQFHHAFKVGAAFNTGEALVRVFTEYVQGRRRDEFRPRAPEALARILKPDFRALPAQDNACDNFLSAFMFGFVPYRDAAFLEEGERGPFRPSRGYGDCLGDINRARSICRTLGRDYIVVDISDPATGFAVVQVVIPGYSDVLPFHPPSSPALFERVQRTDVLNMYA
jgi:ribosomal protein S12 methylthiotransferase accessory factor YcaO